MKKLLTAKDILLLSLTQLLDFIVEIKDPANIISSYYENYYGFIPGRYKKKNFNALIKRSLQSGEIEKVEESGKVYLEITATGEKKIIRKFPLIGLQNKKWDRKWRLVIYDIEEINRIQRNWLRRKLRQLGFGMIQRSVWLSPHDFLIDIKEFLAFKGLLKNVILSETRDIYLDSPKEFANQIWQLDKLDKKYQDIYNKVNRLEQSLDGRVKRWQIKARFRNLYEKFIATILKDPFLPTELLPQDWSYNKTTLKISAVKKKILKIRS